MLNKVMIIGNLGSEPELKALNNGDPVANLSIATTEKWKDKQGEKQEKTEWHRVVLFRKLAELAGQYLHKGSKVYIEGKLQTRSWEQDGVKKFSTEVIAENMKFIGSNQQQAAPSNTQQYTPPPAPQSNDNFDDDLPF